MKFDIEKLPTNWCVDTGYAHIHPSKNKFVDLISEMFNQRFLGTARFYYTRGKAIPFQGDKYSDNIIFPMSMNDFIELVCVRESGAPTSDNTILEEAQKLIYGDRQTSYGSVSKNFNRIAKMWSAILDADVSSEQVAMCMIALKMSRQLNKGSRDNIVDIAGYAGCMEKIEKGE